MLVYSPATKFKNIHFAESVPPTEFDWAESKSQVTRRVLNAMGSRDDAVTFLPGGIQGLGLTWMFGVGAAGYLGFSSQETVDPSAFVEAIDQRQLGNHLAGIDESVWPRIGDFIVDDKIMEEPGLEEPWWRPLAVKSQGLAPMITVGVRATVIRAAHAMGGASIAVLVTFIIAIISLKV